MHKIKSFFISFAALLLFGGISLTATVAALENGGVTGDTSANPPHSAVPVSEDNQGTSSNDSANGDKLAEQFREQAKEKIEAARQDSREQHSLAIREKACTARKNNLAKRMDNTYAQAQRHEEVFNKIYQKVQDFYKDKKLNVSGYDSLKSAADSAQSNAQASVDSLKTLNTDGIDCATGNAAETVSAYQAAVKNTRDSLKAYRAALVDLINSLKGASTGTNSTGSTNDSTNQTNQ